MSTQPEQPARQGVFYQYWVKINTSFPHRKIILIGLTVLMVSIALVALINEDLFTVFYEDYDGIFSPTWTLILILAAFWLAAYLNVLPGMLIGMLVVFLTSLFLTWLGAQPWPPVFFSSRPIMCLGLCEGLFFNPAIGMTFGVLLGAIIAKRQDKKFDKGFSKSIFLPPLVGIVLGVVITIVISSLLMIIYIYGSA